MTVTLVVHHDELVYVCCVYVLVVHHDELVYVCNEWLGRSGGRTEIQKAEEHCLNCGHSELKLSRSRIRKRGLLLGFKTISCHVVAE